MDNPNHRRVRWSPQMKATRRRYPLPPMKRRARRDAQIPPPPASPRPAPGQRTLVHPPPKATPAPHNPWRALYTGMDYVQAIELYKAWR